MKKQVTFSGIQPSGNLHIGNYLGAIKQFVQLQEDNEAIFCIVDEHAITVPQNPKELYQRSLEVAMIYLASGIDPKKSTIFIQSHVPAHAELGWILNTITPLGELERMTQFKEKRLATSDKRHGVLAGLLNYPTLMAADILLYQTDIVPVGEDQLQHLEFTRMIADKFNKKFGQIFKLPKALLNKETARIMSLNDPSKKMSKSDEKPSGCIEILETEKEIRRKIKIAVTDSGNEIKFDSEKKPAISNLLAIYSSFSGKEIKEIEKMYSGKSYAKFKEDMAEVIISGLKPIQQKFEILKKDEKKVKKILYAGAKKASTLANHTLNVVKQKIGFVL